LALAPLGATNENAVEIYDSYAREHSIEQRLARAASHSHQLLAEELEFWS
jgi:hypothetical protein